MILTGASVLLPLARLCMLRNDDGAEPFAYALDAFRPAKEPCVLRTDANMAASGRLKPNICP